MAYCTKCGAFVKGEAKFCGNCGAKIEVITQTEKETDSNQRKTKYEGELHKCPNCGVNLGAFVKSCPECGYELRGTARVESVQEFARRYSTAGNNSQKIDLIRTFVIPNTKEDILEFVILASTNIDESSYVRDNTVVLGGISQQEVAEAWMAKFEQAYQKATLLLADTPELKRIEKLYDEKKAKLVSSQKRGGRKTFWNNNKKWIGIVAGILAFFAFEFMCFLPGLSEKWEFERQLDEVQECIDAGEYEKALTLAYSMNTSYSHDFEKTQADLISRIKELKGETEGKIPIPNTEYEDKQYSDIVQLFQKAGFTNVTAEKVPDLITGWLHSEGEVIEVSIDGSTTFSKGDFYDPNAVVIVRYHGFSD